MEHGPAADPWPRGRTRTEEAADGEWAVRSVTADAATKPYRCPGCDQIIPPGVSHVVAWPLEVGRGADDRRHWHRACWQARLRRSPRIQRPRGGPWSRP